MLGKRNYDDMMWEEPSHLGMEEHELALFPSQGEPRLDSLLDFNNAQNVDNAKLILEEDEEVPCSARTSISSATSCLSSALPDVDWSDAQCPPPPPPPVEPEEAVCVQGSPLSAANPKKEEEEGLATPGCWVQAPPPPPAPIPSNANDNFAAQMALAAASAGAAVHVPMCLPCQPAPVLAVAPAMVPPPSPAQPQVRNLALRADTEIEKVWYADRPFPSFNITLFDVATNAPAENVAGWKVCITVLDGFGQEAWDKVYGQVHNHEYPLWSPETQTPTATIAGIRFRSVSSKAGGHFRVVVRISSPCAASAASIAPLVSGEIQVLSYRLYHAPKVSNDKLKATDSISKMKGIGTLYAKRFANVGVQTVHDLASIDLQQLGDEGTRRLLLALRKERGAMTVDKLESYILQAREIMARCGSPQHQQVARPNPALSAGSSGCLFDAVPCPPSHRFKIQGVDVSALYQFSSARSTPMAYQPIMCHVRLLAHS